MHERDLTPNFSRPDPDSIADRARIRPARPDDAAAAYDVCLRTGDAGGDGTLMFADDPDALGRIFVGPYLAFEPELGLVLEDADGVCGYVLGARDSRIFYERYEAEWRPALCARFAMPQGDPSGWTRVQEVHAWYHTPDYFCPEPCEAWPSHLHIDLLPRVQRRGYGRQMIEMLIARLRDAGSPGVHLGVRPANAGAIAFYRRLGFVELTRRGTGNGASLYMGRRIDS